MKDGSNINSWKSGKSSKTDLDFMY